MNEYIYAIGALVGVMLFSIMINQGRFRSERQIFVNEVATQMVGVAEEVLDLVDREHLPFDSETAGLRAYEVGVDALTRPSGFGGCQVITSCADVDDLHGMAMSIRNQRLDFEVSIEVAYVSRSNPDFVVFTPTMSKRVTVEVKSPSMFIGSEPLTMKLSRVVSFR